MMNYRLSYNGLAGFDYLGFDTEPEAMLWAAHQERLGLIKAQKLMKYDAAEDVYKEIADFSAKQIEVALPHAGQNKQFYVSYKQNDIFHAILVEAPSVKMAERYLLSKKTKAKAVSAREANPGDIKPGIPVLALTEREEKNLRDDFLASDIADLDLSVRAYNCLRRAGVMYVRALVCKSEEDLREMPNMGWKCIDEITSVLASYGECLAPSPEVEQKFPVEIFDYTELENEEEIYTVSVAPGLLVDVKACIKTGLVYAMQNEDGSTVYSAANPEKTFPDYKYDEAAVIKYVKCLCPKLTLNTLMAAAEAKKAAQENPNPYKDQRTCEFSI